MTTLGRSLGRRGFVPVLAGLGCGALIAVASVLVSPHSPPADRVHEQVNALGDRPADLPVPLPVPPLVLPLPPPAPLIGLGPKPAPKPPVETGLSGPALAVFTITNAQRAAHGCSPLKVDSRLTKIAQQHSRDMAVRGYFEHDTPEGRSFGDREIAAGYPANKTGGENIAYGQESAKEVMNVWINSPPHRRNILDCEFTTIGVGWYPANNYWTQDFGY